MSLPLCGVVEALMCYEKVEDGEGVCKCACHRSSPDLGSLLLRLKPIT